MAKYATAKAYRSALETRIVNEHRESKEDVSRLRKKVAFDAALARLYAHDHGFVLKGGYALELRLKTSRSTKDLDFVTKRLLRATLSKKKEDRPESLRSMLEQALQSKTNGDDDFFAFIVGEPMTELVGGVYRYPTEARLDGRKFESFQMDISIGDFVSEENDKIKRASRARIPADISSEYVVELITKEQHFAEKLHAYSLPRDGINSRAKDLVDMVLLIQSGLRDRDVMTMITHVFEHRTTHESPTFIKEPPRTWAAPYEKLARECGVNISFDEAYHLVRTYYETFRETDR